MSIINDIEKQIIKTNIKLAIVYKLLDLAMMREKLEINDFSKAINELYNKVDEEFKKLEEGK